MLDSDVQYLLDRFDIMDTMTRLFVAMDRRDWDTVRACLTDPLSVALTGPATPNINLDTKPVPLDDFMTGLVARNGGFAATLHMHPNQLVTIDGQGAHVTSYQIAPHSVGPREGETLWGYGLYEIDLLRASPGWRIAKILIDVRIANNVDPARIYELAARRLRNANPD